MALEPLLGEAGEQFAETVYASVRAAEFQSLGWPPDHLRAFLKTQYDLQRRAYEMQFPGAEYSVIKTGQISAGRLVVRRAEGEIRLIDIALLPEFRGRGIGTEVIAGLIAEAETSGRPLTLQVLLTNEAARRLYLRLGFSVVGEDELYVATEKRLPGGFGGNDV